jgi:hypothetical protein
LSVSAALYATAAAIGVRLTRKLPVSRPLAWVLLVLSPFLKVLLVSGQNSAFALLALCASWWALEKKRVLLAGFALGTLVFKPQLLAGAVALCLLAGEWRLVVGAAAGAGLQLGVGWAWAGTAVMRSYVEALSGPVRSAGIPEPLPELVHGLAGTARLLFGPGGWATLVYLLTSAIALVVAARAWRAAKAPAARVAILCISAVLVCPHLYVYDLVIVAPALLVCCDDRIIVDSALRKAGFVLVWLVWFAPLFGPVALATRVQWSTILLAGLLIVLGRAARQTEISG